MSWIDQVNEDFKITTGDGAEYLPNWLNASIGKEFNISEFTFPDVPGTLAVRFKPKGRKLTLEIYFQGDDHLSVWKDFDKSSNDPRAWVISHPFYERILVQPLSMMTDHSQYNVSKVTITVVETLTDENPVVTTNPADTITELELQIFDDTNKLVLEISPSPVDVPNLKKKNSDLYNIAKNKINNNLDLDNYYNLYNKANTAINLFTSFPQQAMSALQTFINYPSLFADTVRNRFAILKAQFDALFAKTDTKNGKTIYEFTASSLIASMSVATVTNAVYDNRDDVLFILNDLLDVYNTFIKNLDSIQSDVNNSKDAYLPDSQSMMDLRDIVNLTASQLFAIALNSKQQRTYICEADTNVLLLAHRFYGLLPDDSTIDQIIADNNIGLSELLQIKKGRSIIYYV